jgi:hypothetical protein
VKKNGFALQYASEELKADREIVVAAVKRDGLALGYVSEGFKDDIEIVLAAVQQNGLALQYASEELRNDRKVVLAVIQQNEEALMYAPEELQAKILNSRSFEGLKSPSIEHTGAKASISSSNSKAKQPNPKLNI